MWPFKKKTPKSSLALPPLPELKKEAETKLSFEDVPEELPELEVKPKTGKAVIKSPDEEFIVSEETHADAKKSKEIPIHSEKGKYISAERYKNLLGEMNNTNIDLGNIDFGLSRAFEIKNHKDSMTEKLQGNLEEVGEKLMGMEETLFGG